MMQETASNRRWWILSSTSLGTLLSVINGSIVNVALPTLAVDLGIGLEKVQWIVLIYLLTIASVLPIMGRLADMLGRKYVYTNGFLLIIAGSIACALAPSLPWLLAARIVQALGAAMPMANGMAIVTTSFPSSERGQALGIVGTMVALGALIGPTLGGIIVGWFNWHWIFYLNVPLGLIAYVTARHLLPEDAPRERQQRFDLPGALLFSLSMVTLLLATSNGTSWGWNSPEIVVLLLSAVILMILFVFNESRSSHPLVDLLLFRNRSFSTGLTAATFSFVGLSANMILMPFYLQDVLGYDPARVGILMAPSPLLMGLVAPVSGWLSDRLPHRILTTGGLLISAIGLYLFSQISAVATYWQVAIYLALLGVGTGLFQSPNNSSVMGSVPRSKLGIANGINSLMRNVGMVLGTALMVTVLTAVKNARLTAVSQPSAALETAAFLAGWKVVFSLAAVLTLAAAIISATRGKLPQETNQEQSNKDTLLG